ncbi:putative oxidoreductase GLYR1 homolog isoform X2 [Dendroctonus ponderosae]|uniref:putative oxidoreductase GLYR1 homolog isoform X2 n=1 Tax=Dendroctonus ponderosae TaxID=77166 RepID=UPI00203537DB|nr:putative oxidoreductase GLYR1 homolog isoform X2 [Dendroctonus ponderosae]
MKTNFKAGDLVWTHLKKDTVAVWPARVENHPDQAAKGQIYVYYFNGKPNKQNGWAAPSSITEYNEETKAKLSQASSRADFKIAVAEIEAEYQKSKRKSSNESGECSTSASKIAKGKRKPASEPVENGTKQYKAIVADTVVGGDGRTSPNSELDPIDQASLVTGDFGGTPQDMTPTSIIGFLGLGIMSTGMVNNLIKAGHKVNLWSRQIDKCYKLKEKVDEVNEGQVNVCVAPCDVMSESDIVFNCCSDPETAQKNVSDNCGVTHDCENLNGKGFVEMTGIDPNTSLKLSEYIHAKGGRYLEAQLQGSRDEAADGTLLVLTAGDNSLFIDCQSCFQAISKSSLYLGEVGVASKVYLIMQLMQGISLVGLAECLVLADRCGISGKDIINIFNMTNMSSPYLRKKANKIVDKDFKQVEQSIKNMQKDFRLALGLSDELMQPLILTSAANEVFKHSRKLGYDDHDCSCIYMKARKGKEDNAVNHGTKVSCMKMVLKNTQEREV